MRSKENFEQKIDFGVSTITNTNYIKIKYFKYKIQFWIVIQINFVFELFF